MRESERDGAADVRLDGPLDLRTLRLPPGVVRRTVTLEPGWFLCADGAAWCGELVAVIAGTIDVVLPSGAGRRLTPGALLFVDGLTGVELRCVGAVPATLTGVRRAATGSSLLTQPRRP